MMMRAMVLALVALAVPGWASTKDWKVLHGRLEQGGFVVARVAEGAKVFLDQKPLWVSKSGLVVAGFDRNATAKHTVTVCPPGGACSEVALDVAKRTYVTQNLTHVPPKTVEPGPAEWKRMKADYAAKDAARAVAARSMGESEAFGYLFERPVAGGVTSSVFGSRRTYNGEERSWHNGYDFAVPRGTPVRAPADGTVRLARSTFMSGNLIMLDHGGDVTSVYAHLSEMDVHVGDKVKAGQVIGKVGTTGRSTGPHLHWGIYWKNTPLDPILWVSN